MIVIKIQGGLGNQLFQYSFGRLLEVKYKKIVAYDISFYTTSNKYTPRKFLLDKFNTKMRVATEYDVCCVKYPYGVLSKLLTLFKKMVNKYIFKKYKVVYDDKLLPYLEKNDNLYLEGFWQSYLYCFPVMDQLCKELVLRDKKDDELGEYFQKISASDSVAVHIRRGDYLSCGKDLQVLDKDYYKRAVKFLETKVDKPNYFIFSDDISWVKDEMADLFNGAVYITGNFLKDYEELMLMASCKHDIIANSSFSWWGAVLNNAKDKIVISPKDWKNIHFKADDNLCPKDWIRV